MRLVEAFVHFQLLSVCAGVCITTNIHKCTKSRRLCVCSNYSEVLLVVPEHALTASMCFIHWDVLFYFIFIYLLINKAQKGITLISHAELI